MEVMTFLFGGGKLETTFVRASAQRLERWALELVRARAGPLVSDFFSYKRQVPEPFKP